VLPEALQLDGLELNRWTLDLGLPTGWFCEGGQDTFNVWVCFLCVMAEGPWVKTRSTDVEGEQWLHSKCLINIRFLLSARTVFLFLSVPPSLGSGT
jgi:hypothetical protein